MKNAVYVEKKIVLSYRDNMITFELAALDFTTPDKNQYKFMLEGFDVECYKTVEENNLQGKPERRRYGR